MAQQVAQGLAAVYDADVKSLPAVGGAVRPSTPSHAAAANSAGSAAATSAAAAAAHPQPPTAVDGAGNGAAAAAGADRAAPGPPEVAAAPPPPAKGFGGGAMSAFKRLRQKAKQTIQDTASRLNEGIKETMNEMTDATRKPVPGEYPSDPDVDVAAVIAARLKGSAKQGWLLRKDPKALLPTWHKEFYAIKDGSVVRIGKKGGGGAPSPSSKGDNSADSSSDGGAAGLEGIIAALAASAEQEEVICPLQLSTVRLNTKKDVSSRPFCFELISPMCRVMLQACGTRDLQEWKLALEGASNPPPTCITQRTELNPIPAGSRSFKRVLKVAEGQTLLLLFFPLFPLALLLHVFDGVV